MLKFIFSLALLVFFLALVVDPREFVTTLAAVHPAPLAAMAVLVVVLSAVSAWRWRLLLRPLGYLRSRWQILRAQLIGQGINIIVPGGLGGDFVKVFLIAEPPDRGVSQTLATVGVERLLGVAALGAIVAILVIDPALARHLPGPLSEFSQPLALTLLALGVLGAVLVIRLDKTLPQNASGFRLYLNAIARMFEAIVSYRKRPATLAGAFAASVVCHLIAGLAVWVVAVQLHPVSYPVVLLVVMVSFLLTLLPITVGGLGTREVVFYYMLAKEGFTPEAATALSLIWFMLNSIVAVTLAAAANLTPGASVDRDLFAIIQRRRRANSLRQRTGGEEALPAPLPRASER
jgi:glycosyltransferase 2 family protein